MLNTIFKLLYLHELIQPQATLLLLLLKHQRGGNAEKGP